MERPTVEKFRIVCDWLNDTSEEWNDQYKSFEMIERVYDAMAESDLDVYPDDILCDVDWAHIEDYQDEINLAMKVDALMGRLYYHNIIMRHYEEELYKKQK